MSIQRYLFKGSIDGRRIVADGEDWWCRASDVKALEKRLAAAEAVCESCGYTKIAGTTDQYFSTAAYEAWRAAGGGQ